MRLNWSLKHSETMDFTKARDITPEEYLRTWGYDLDIGAAAFTYTQIDPLKLESDMAVKLKTLNSLYERRTRSRASTESLERYNLWDGVTVTLILDKKGTPLPKYRPNDKHLKIRYLHVFYHNGQPTHNCFELNITKYRYLDISPLEYYSYTDDYPILD